MMVQPNLFDCFYGTSSVIHAEAVSAQLSSVKSRHVYLWKAKLKEGVD